MLVTYFHFFFFKPRYPKKIKKIDLAGFEAGPLAEQAKALSIILKLFE